MPAVNSRFSQRHANIRYIEFTLTSHNRSIICLLCGQGHPIPLQHLTHPMLVQCLLHLNLASIPMVFPPALNTVRPMSGPSRFWNADYGIWRLWNLVTRTMKDCIDYKLFLNGLLSFMPMLFNCLQRFSPYIPIRILTSCRSHNIVFACCHDLC
jgi:hypothetical protein